MTLQRVRPAAVPAAYEIVEIEPAADMVKHVHDAPLAEVHARVRFLEQQNRAEVFPARKEVLGRLLVDTKAELQERQFWDALGQRVELPITFSGTRFTGHRNGLYVGGLDKPVAVEYERTSLYIGPVPDEAVQKFNRARECDAAVMVVASTVREHFSFADVPKPFVRADPLLIAFTPVGQYLLHAWDWQSENLG